MRRATAIQLLRRHEHLCFLLLVARPFYFRPYVHRAPLDVNADSVFGLSR